MKGIFTYLFAFVAMLFPLRLDAQDKMVSEVAFDHDANLETFGFGADISWLSQQESWGTYYCNRAGKRADLMDILKEDFGINALRFRVWVNPAGGWSGKKDVIGLCKRAHAKGFKIMVSFHYSDTWADSGNQTIPAQWTDHSADALEKNVYDHTRDVLSGLKAEGIIPVWVSIGNETKQGMQDIVKSLEWVRDNISLFGGDPANVTIAVQSGGGGKVSTLLAMPSAKGLFKRAIVQSGSTIRQGDAEASRKFGVALAEELGQKGDETADFSKFTCEELNEAANRVSRKGIRAGFSPVVDGTILPQHPFAPASELSRDVPMLIGTNFNEFTFDISRNMTEEEAVKSVKGRMGEENGQKFVDAFHKAFPDAPAKAMTYVDTGFRASAVQQAAAKSKQGGAPAYLYLFTWAPTSNALGASHGMELPFMLHNVSLQREMTGASAEAYKFEQVISSIWLSFIKTGNPNVKGQPKWEPYNEQTGVTMVLDNKCRAVQHLDDELMKFARPIW